MLNLTYQSYIVAPHKNWGFVEWYAKFGIVRHKGVCCLPHSYDVYGLLVKLMCLQLTCGREISGIIKQCALEEDNIFSNPLSSKPSENVKNWLKEYKVWKKQAIIIKTSFVEVYIF